MAKVKLLDPSDSRRKLDRYELIGEIATGGMATVFLARLGGVGGFQRFVAIKRLHPHLANEQEFVEMFLDEARLAALIHHPHVVPILEVGMSDSGYYIVMEYVEGDTLSKMVARTMSTGKMVPRPILMRVLLDTFAGLHAAHELADDRGQLLGLVHRDVSPQNVLVGVDGSTRLTDFGVARATARLTSTGSGKLKGKLAYMAPEQTRGDELDRRTDLFAAGIILWECLAGKRLFKAESEAATLSRILVDPVKPVSAVNPEVPTPFDEVVLKALDREPAKRFQTAADMGDALEKVARDVGRTEGVDQPIASAREVAAFMQSVLGQEIGAQRESVRAWLAQSDSGQPKITLPKSTPPRSSSESSSGVAFAKTDFVPTDSGELPVTHIEPSSRGGRPIAPLADVTMRFALQEPPAAAIPLTTKKNADTPLPVSANGAEKIAVVERPSPRIAPPPKPSQPTLLGTGPVGVPAARPSRRSSMNDGSRPSDPRADSSAGLVSLEADRHPSGLATHALGDDGDDAVTVLKPSDAPAPPPRAYVSAAVKTQRGLFGGDLLKEAEELAARANGTPEGMRIELLSGDFSPAGGSGPHDPPPPPVSVSDDPPVIPPLHRSEQYRSERPRGASTLLGVGGGPSIPVAPNNPSAPPPAATNGTAAADTAPVSPTASLTNGSMTLPGPSIADIRPTARAQAELPETSFGGEKKSATKYVIIAAAALAFGAFAVWFAFLRTPSSSTATDAPAPSKSAGTTPTSTPTATQTTAPTPSATSSSLTLTAPSTSASPDVSVPPPVSTPGSHPQTPHNPVVIQHPTPPGPGPGPIKTTPKPPDGDDLTNPYHKP